MTTAKEVMKLIKDNDVKYADFRFTDPRGKWQHVTFDISMMPATPAAIVRRSTSVISAVESNSIIAAA
jgi:glutamine synthetase